MRKQRKSAMIMSLVMLVTAAMAMTTVSYAWFTSGDVGIVDTFDFSAQAASGLQLSADGTTWKTTVTGTDIAAAVAASRDKTGGSQYGSMFTVESAQFQPVSSTNDAASGKLTMYKAAANMDGTFKTEIADSGYYVFNLYVKNMGTETKYLNLYNDTAEGAYKITSVTDKSDKDKDTSTAARIGFVAQSSVTQETDQTVAAWETTAMAKADGTSCVIYEPNASTRIPTNSQISGKQSYNSINSAKDAAVASNGVITDEEVVKAAATITDTDITSLAKDGGNMIATLAANSITKITVYVWLEGQDIDCINDISAGTVSTKLCFEGYKEAE